METLLPQAVAPTRRTSVICEGVVPVSGLMDVSSGCQCGAGRHADRTVRIGGGEAGPALGEAVDVRRPHHRVAVAARDVPRVLVREDEEEVGWIHPSGSSSSSTSTFDLIGGDPHHLSVLPRYDRVPVAFMVQERFSNGILQGFVDQCTFFEDFIDVFSG